MVARQRIRDNQLIFFLFPMNKKAVELSVNFLVVTILAMVTFAGSAYFIREIYSSSTNTLTDLRSSMDEKISVLSCNSQDVVCITGNNAKYTRKDNVAVAGVFVTNLKQEQVITITELAQRYYKDGQTNTFPSDIAVIVEDPKVIEKNKKGDFYVGMGIEKSTPSGTYEFDIKIEGTAPDAFETVIKTISFTVN